MVTMLQVYKTTKDI